MSQPAAVFDLDGTLVDTAPDFVTAVNTQRHSLWLGASCLPTHQEQCIKWRSSLVHLSLWLAMSITRPMEFGLKIAGFVPVPYQ